MFPLLTLSDVPLSAYNPNRLASDLIKTQVRHALDIEDRLPASLRSGLTLKLDTLTEGQAAAFLEHITRISHPAGAPKAPAPARRRRKPAPRPKAARRPKARKPAARPAKARRVRRQAAGRPAKRSRR